MEEGLRVHAFRNKAFCHNLFYNPMLHNFLTMAFHEGMFKTSGWHRR